MRARLLGKIREPVEFMLAIVTVFGALITVFQVYFSNPKEPTTLTIKIAGAFAGMTLLALLFRRFRSFYIIQDVRPVMRELCLLARKARHRVWTVRSHLGEPDEENEYFEILASRGRDPNDPVEDIRRIIRLNSAVGTREHVHWLIERLADQVAAKVHYYTGPGPVFDFAIMDDIGAGLGFPASAGAGFSGSLFTRSRSAIQGFERAFEVLWAESEVLFEGRKGCSSDDKHRLKQKVDELLQTLNNCP